MTINDLAFEMAKDKENRAEIKKLEKKINSWENLKAYPDLEDVYQLGYIIEINPGELLALRNRGRKQFYRESDDAPKKRKDWVEISDNFAIYGSAFMKLFGIFGVIFFAIWFARFVDIFWGDSAVKIEEEIVVRQIKEHTEENYVPINDGTVQNFLKRKNKEKYEGSIENIKATTGYYEDHPEEVKNTTENVLE